MSATAQPQPAPRVSPVNDLVNLLIVMLTPVFLGPAGGDLRLARLGAQQVLLAFKAEHHADWLTIAQIVAFGLATVNTLCLSFVEDLPIQAVLRLNNSADRLSKAEMRHRKLRHEPVGQAVARPAPSIQPVPVPAATPPAATNPPPATPAEAATAKPAPPNAPVGQPARITGSAGTAMPRMGPPTSESRRGAPALSVVQADPSDAEQCAAWLESAARVAGEYLAAMPDLDPAAAEQAMLRASALSEAARDVAAGGPLPVEPVFSLAFDSGRRR
jgi:hypothetical protein